METFCLENDIIVFTVTAGSFPKGIAEAHETLHAMAPVLPGRKYFGISRPEQERGIVYKAAAEELADGELSSRGLAKFIIKKGNYISITIRNYMHDITAIGTAFEQLTDQENIDPNGYCIEWYLNDTDVICMIKLN